MATLLIATLVPPTVCSFLLWATVNVVKDLPETKPKGKSKRRRRRIKL